MHALHPHVVFRCPSLRHHHAICEWPHYMLRSLFFRFFCSPKKTATALSKSKIFHLDTSRPRASFNVPMMHYPPPPEPLDVGNRRGVCLTLASVLIFMPHRFKYLRRCLENCCVSIDQPPHLGAGPEAWMVVAQAHPSFCSFRKLPCSKQCSWKSLDGRLIPWRVTVWRAFWLWCTL